MIKNINTELKDFENQILYDKIEVFIQQSENIFIPAIIFEYLKKENNDFDGNDLIEFYEQFGDIEDFQLKGKISIVLFSTFFSVNTCKEFLENKNNFKNNMNDDFKVRWFDYKNDLELLSEDTKEKYEYIMMKNYYELKKKSLIYFNEQHNNSPNNISQNNSINNSNIYLNNIIQPNLININKNPFIIPQQNLMNMNTGFNLNQNNINLQLQNIHINDLLNSGRESFNNQNQTINNNNNNNNNINNNLNNINFMNNIKNSPTKNHKHNNLKDEKPTSNKFTCKYEILISNDKEFQISRRLIGSKGCNMKKIIDECKLKLEENGIKTNNINEIVKLRLRGKGSGYKEGPQNKESNESLHLCISSKNQEGLIIAIELVDNLINKIYEDYKKHCIKKGINFLPKLANKIIGNYKNNVCHKK